MHQPELPKVDRRRFLVGLIAGSVSVACASDSSGSSSTSTTAASATSNQSTTAVAATTASTTTAPQVTALALPSDPFMLGVAAGDPTDTAVILWTAMVSGGLAGLAGVGELCALQYRLIMDISPGYGYSGIVIAMLGNLHPVGVFFSSLFFSVIIVGAHTMSRMTGGPTYIAEVIQGMALIIMLIFLLFTEYRIRVVRK